MCEYNCRVRTPKAAKAETTKQKQHTTHNHSPSSSVAMSVHCCSHWCSDLTFIPPSCIGVRTLHFSCVPFRWSYRLAFRVCVCHSNSYKRLFVARCVAASPCRPAVVSIGVLPNLSAGRGSIGYCISDWLFQNRYYMRGIRRRFRLNPGRKLMHESVFMQGNRSSNCKY